MKNRITLISMLCAVLLIIAGVGAYTLFNQNKQIEKLTTDKILTAAAFEVGILDTDTGKLDKEAEEEYAMYTGYYKAADLDVELEKDTELTYKVFFYDEDKEFISCTNYLDVDFDESEVEIPATAKYVRLVVNTDEVKVTAMNKATLLKDITITVAK